MRQVCLALLLLAACSAPPLGRPAMPQTPALWLRVRPPIAIGPTDLRIELRVARHPDNRAWAVSAFDQADGLAVRATAEQLDGDVAPIFHAFWWPGFLSGNYEVVAWLTGVNGRRATVRQAVIVH